ncbi:hypothetical protein LTS18_008861, partial [Coniosporium uncinatum]
YPTRTSPVERCRRCLCPSGCHRSSPCWCCCRSCAGRWRQQQRCCVVQFHQQAP